DDRIVAVLEHARPVAQPQVNRGQVRTDLTRTPVVEVDVEEHVRDLDPVRADVLHRGRPGAAGDPGQAFQPTEPGVHGGGEEGVTVPAALHGGERARAL